MPRNEWLVLMWMGGLFILLGVAAFIWGRNEEKNYYNALSTHFDVREFLSHWPPRLEPKALRIGGAIAIVLGLTMLIAGGALMLQHKVF